MTARVWAEIDIAAIRDNLAAIRSYVGPQTDVMAVVKANAYGHGLDIVTRAAGEAGAGWFGVATVAEGAAVRRILPDSSICLFAPFLGGEEEEIVRAGITPLLSSEREAALLSAECERQSASVDVHIEIDTGMGRSGTLPEEASKLASAVQQYPRLRLSGVATHLPSGDTDPEFTAAQVRAISDVVERLTHEGARLEVIHAANSGGTITAPAGRFNLIRPGLLMYGIRPIAVPAAQIPEVRPLLSLKTTVALIRRLPEGRSISYARTHILTRPSIVATLPVGYGDGYPRELSNRGHTLIGSQRAPILGRVCMDMTVVDITEIDGVREGDEVVLIGGQGTESIRTEEIAELIGTTEHDVTTRLTERVTRVGTSAQVSATRS